MIIYGTNVKNPCKRHGSGFSQCIHCGKYYTSMGISRHWHRCPDKRQQTAKESIT